MIRQVLLSIGDAEALVTMVTVGEGGILVLVPAAAAGLPDQLLTTVETLLYRSVI